MKSDTYEELNNALKNLGKEKINLQSQIDENNLHIQETQSLNQKIDCEDEDFRIFSPRRYKNLYKDELEKSNIEREDYETQNSQLIEKMEKLNNLIKVMQDVMEETETDKEEVETEHLNNFEFEDNSLYENLEYVLHKVELSIKFMSQDPDRAKMELSVVSENLRKILYQKIEEA